MTEEPHDMTMIDAAFTDFSKEILAEGIETVEEAIAWMLKFSPGFENNQIFQRRFEPCFMILLCKKKIEERDVKTRTKMETE